MSADDRERRTARLTAAAAARTTDATARARRAIPTAKHRSPVTFVDVARDAGVSTSFLYQHSQLRDDITNLRTTTTTTATAATGRAASLESLRTKLATAIARNRELTEQLAQLRTENEALRSRLLESRIPAATPHPS